MPGTTTGSAIRHDEWTISPKFHMGTSQNLSIHVLHFDISRKLFHDWRMRWKFDSLKMHDRSSVNNWTQMVNKIFGLKRYPRRSENARERGGREKVVREWENGRLIQQTLVSICGCCYCFALVILSVGVAVGFPNVITTPSYSALRCLCLRATMDSNMLYLYYYYRSCLAQLFDKQQAENKIPTASAGWLGIADEQMPCRAFQLMRSLSSFTKQKQFLFCENYVFGKSFIFPKIINGWRMAFIA